MQHNIPAPEVDEELKWKARFLIVIVVALFMVLIFRLVDMQIFNGSYYESLARNNRIRIVSVKAPRGKILDRNSIVLADNRPTYNLMVIPEDISNVDQVAARLAGIIDSSVDEISDTIRTGMSRPYDPVYLDKDISFDQVARIETDIFHLPGVSIEATTERDYVYKDLASHVLGFLGEISKKELTAHHDAGYEINDLIGKGGIEMICEKDLRGSKGIRVFEVDALGRKIKVMDERSAVPGRDSELTIDKQLQVIASDALGSRAGAVVAINPSNGEILAMVSKPDFDPSMFLTPMAPEMWQQIIEDPLHPLENRAFRGQYPPGSIFKILIALAGLSTKTITQQDTFYCPGYYTLGTTTFRCWKETGHEDVNLPKAIEESCDVYFYSLGKQLGIDVISQYARYLGFGLATGIEFQDETTGLVPTRQWKAKRFGTPWMPGETVITSIGQGFTLVTPLQVAKAMSAVVNGGYLREPRILRTSNPEFKRVNEISLEDLLVVKEALRSVVEGEHGTAKGIKDPMFSIGGKTGTAQVAKGYTSRLVDESDIPYKYRDHAWFFGFSPVEAPEILVVAVVEHGGHGSSIASPIVRDVIKGYYFLKGYANGKVRKDNQ